MRSFSFAPSRVFVISLLLFTGCGKNTGGSSAATTQPGASVGGTLQSLGLNTFLELVQLAGLENILEGPDPLTLVPPTDAAFDSLPPGRLDELRLSGNLGELRDLLLYHFVEGEHSLASVEAVPALHSLNGSKFTIGALEGAIFFNGSSVEDGDVQTPNGVLHTLNEVLIPQVHLVRNLEARGFSTYLELMRRAGLDGSEFAPPRTVFAPTDAAFEALPDKTLEALLAPGNQAALRRLIEHHIVAGRQPATQLLAQGEALTVAGTTLRIDAPSSSFRVEGVHLAIFDKPSLNGILHGIETVLSVPSGGDGLPAQRGKQRQKAPLEPIWQVPQGPWRRIGITLQEPLGHLQEPLLVRGAARLRPAGRYPVPGGQTYVWLVKGPAFEAGEWTVIALPAPYVRLETVALLSGQ